MVICGVARTLGVRSMSACVIPFASQSQHEVYHDLQALILVRRCSVKYSVSELADTATSGGRRGTRVTMFGKPN